MEAFVDPVPALPAADVLSAGALRPDHPGDYVAAQTETAQEFAIDRANGLRGAAGRPPQPEDFADVLSPEGDSGDAVGTEIIDDPWVFGEDGSTGGTAP